MNINDEYDPEFVSCLPPDNRVQVNHDRVTGSTDYNPFDEEWKDMHRGEFEDMDRRERIDLHEARRLRNGCEWD